MAETGGAVVRQLRSETTRAAIIAAAIDVFGINGYAAAALTEVLERSGLSKGAFYYHFDSKEALAAAIIEETDSALARTLASVVSPSKPALEGLIHGCFLAAERANTDAAVATGIHLSQALAGFNEVAGGVYHAWIRGVGQQVSRAVDEGDVRDELGPSELVGQLIVAAMIGMQVLHRSRPSHVEMSELVRELWTVLLPMLTRVEALDFWTEFLRRQSTQSKPSGLPEP